MIKKIVIGIVLAIVLLSFYNDRAAKYVELLEGRMNSYPSEKVYIHHDKPIYAAGDDLWFKVYLVDARSHLPSVLSRLVYVDLVNDQDSIIAHRSIKIDSSFSSGDISIPFEVEAGDYLLRGYTNYMRNYDPAFFFNKQIRIIGSGNELDDLNDATEADDSKVDLDFFPEGGDLTTGLKSKVAFKCVNSKGYGVEVVGNIVDNNGEQVAILKTLHNGMGYFEITPGVDLDYSAVIQVNGANQKFQLPKVQKEGFALRVNATNKDYFTIKVDHKDAAKIEGAFIIGHIRGEPFIVLQDLESGKLLKLSKGDLPEGVTHITLFDAKSKPVAERLIYIDNDKSVLHLQPKLNKSDIAIKEYVEIDLNIEKGLLDTVGLANLSVAITDRSLLPSKDASDISNYLLLDSELTGSVEDAQFYFTDRNKKKRFLLDLVMMTNGWRRFNWTDIIENKEPSLSFPPESGFEVSGTVTKSNKPDQTVSADIFMTVMNQEFMMNQMTTESDGRFVFSELPIEGSVPLVLQANEHNAKKKRKNKDDGPSGKRNVDIILDPPSYPSYDHLPLQINGLIDRIDNYGQYEDVLQSKLELNKMLSGELSVDLSEVTVKGKRISAEKKLDRPGQLYSEPSNRLILDSLPGIIPSQTVFDIIRTRVPGVEILGTPGIDAEFRIRGIKSINLSSTAMVMVDGMQTNAIYLNTLIADQIEYIDVIKGLSRTAVFGEAGSSGVVAIYTKLASGVPRKLNESVNGILNSTFEGYYLAREFYMPNYEISPSNQGLPDIRPTLYWNPNVDIDQNGKATLGLFTAQKSSTYSIDIQGMTRNGVPVVGSLDFEVR